MSFKPAPRKVAAWAFLLVAGLPAGLVLILADLGGLDGLIYLLTPESGAQHLVAYLIELSVFLLCASGLLFSAARLSGAHLMLLIGLVLCHIIAGLAFASATVPTAGLALLCLILLYRERSS